LPEARKYAEIVVENISDHGKTKTHSRHFSIDDCKKFGLNPDATVVVRIDQLFGQQSSVALMHSYESTEAMAAVYRKKKERKAAEKKASAKGG
jgi:ribosomal protein S24E